MGDLPRVPVRVDEHAGVAAPERRASGPGDRRAGAPGLREHGVDLLRRADVVGERDAAPAAAVLDAAVLGELAPAPQREHTAADLEERDVVPVVRGAPAERLVEGPRARHVRDAERDEAQALLHRGMMTRARGAGRAAGPCGQGWGQGGGTKPGTNPSAAGNAAGDGRTPVRTHASSCAIASGTCTGAKPQWEVPLV